MGTNIVEMQSLLAKKDARIRELEVSYHQVYINTKPWITETDEIKKYDVGLVPRTYI